MKKNSVASLVTEMAEKITLLTPNKHSNIYENVISYKPFDDTVIGFINDFSRAILSNVRFKRYPELITLAFWMRRSNIQKLKMDFFSRNGDRLIASRGEALHFAPANVDTIFIYSLFLSLLVGNKNIVRVSSKESEQQKLIIEVLSELLSKDNYNHLQQYVLIINYEHSDEITKKLSSCCDVRIIWGGDQTIEKISGIVLQPKAVEIKFANKYSYAVFGAKSIACWDDNAIVTLAKNFINDSYFFGQMGCSSPRNVYWLGNRHEVSVAQTKFWPAVQSQLKHFEHGLAGADFVNKFVVECDVAVTRAVSIPEMSNMLVSRVQNRSLSLFSDTNEHCGAGLFFEDVIEDLSDLGGVIQRNTQTLVYAGIDRAEFLSVIERWSILPDRIVPCGEALMFEKIWDGYDLLESFSRFVSLK